MKWLEPYRRWRARPWWEAFAVPSFAVLSASIATTAVGSWWVWLRWLVAIVGVLAVGTFVLDQLSARRIGTLYAIEAIRADTLSTHRRAERLAREDQQDYRPIYRLLPIPHEAAAVDLTAEMEELRRAVESARQSDREDTGTAISLNLLWPAGFYLGFMAPFPDELTLVEFGKPGARPIRLPVTISSNQSAAEWSLRCGCILRPTIQNHHGDACANGRRRVVLIELTNAMSDDTAAVDARTVCCTSRVRLVIDQGACRQHTHAQPPPFVTACWTDDKAVAFTNSTRGRLQLTGTQLSGIANWIADQLLDIIYSGTRLVLRARISKTFSYALGAHVQRHAENDMADKPRAAQTVWAGLELVHEDSAGASAIMRVHPAQR